MHKKLWIYLRASTYIYKDTYLQITNKLSNKKYFFTLSGVIKIKRRLADGGSSKFEL